MLTLITRSATLLKLVVALQILAAVAIVSAMRTTAIAGAPALLWAFNALLVVAVFSALRFAIVGLQFVLTQFAASPTPVHHKLTLWSAIAMIWHECTASFGAFVWSMPFRSNVIMPQPIDSLKPAKIPVLLIHGYGCNRAMWTAFAAKLTAQGHPNAAINLEPVLGSIDDYVENIAQGVEQLLKQTGATRIALVAHSMGGLASRAFMNSGSLEQNDRIASIITLGTPHQGTVLAVAGQGQNTKQMRRVSAWREQLSQRERPADIAKFVCILSHHDNIVAPQAEQFIAGSKVIEISAIGHVTMAYSPKTFDIVCRELALVQR